MAVVHYDLKPENVLLADEHSVRLCDFGSANGRQWPELSKARPRSVLCEIEVFFEGRSTPMFRPPELADPDLVRFPITSKVDLFTLGLCLFQMLFAVHPFPEEGKLANIHVKYTLHPDASLRYSDGLLDTLKALLQRDPQDRPSARVVRDG